MNLFGPRSVWFQRFPWVRGAQRLLIIYEYVFLWKIDRAVVILTAHPLLELCAVNDQN